MCNENRRERDGHTPAVVRPRVDPRNRGNTHLDIAGWESPLWQDRRGNPLRRADLPPMYSITFKEGEGSFGQGTSVQVVHK